MAGAPYVSGMNRLQAARTVAGLTQDQLAARAGVSQGYVAMLERGYLPLRPSATLTAIADALDLEAWQLFTVAVPDDRLPRELAEAALA